MIYTPMDNQREALRFMLKNPRSGFFMRMGTGKTVTTLTVLEILMYEMARVRRVLLFAPLRVAAISWPDEITKWSHTRNLSYSFIHGMKKEEAIKAAWNSDIVAVNFEGAQWLNAHKDLFPHFDVMIVDESTWIKNPTAERTKVLHKIARFIPRIHILSGSPSPNGLMDLWSQIFLLDRGKRLGENITEYRRRYFFKSEHQYGYYLRSGAKREIVDLISDLVVVVDKKGQTGIPPVVNNVVKIELPKKLRKQYDELEGKFLTTLDCGHSIEALNQQARAQKLRQFVSGFVYKTDYTVVNIHEERLKALLELLKSLEGSNVLISIQFREEVNQIQAFLKKHKFIKDDLPFINSESKKSQDTQTIRDWQAGKLPILLAHPASIGHGLNLQSGGSDIIWYSLTWNLEEWEQYIARLARMGQLSESVMNHILLMTGTIDEPIFISIIKKDSTQQSLMLEIKEWRERKRV